METRTLSACELVAHKPAGTATALRPCRFDASCDSVDALRYEMSVDPKHHEPTTGEVFGASARETVRSLDETPRGARIRCANLGALLQQEVYRIARLPSGLRRA